MYSVVSSEKCRPTADTEAFRRMREKLSRTQGFLLDNLKKK